MQGEEQALACGPTEHRESRRRRSLETVDHGTHKSQLPHYSSHLQPVRLIHVILPLGYNQWRKVSCHAASNS